jgi:NAD-dependent SIR2 family protein deacetylase
MQFVADGPDIPISLLRAQRDGSLIFVVGAGVSRTAGLPLFGGLVDQVYAELGQALPGEPGSLASRAEEDARKAGQYDRLIGLLEQRLVYRRSDWRQPRNSVREAVARLVQSRRRASLAAHADLLDLSRGADGRPRIVTTNFDTLFERVWHRQNRKRLPSSACQSIPAVGSHDFTGVLHLHGRIADRACRLVETDLVLSAANFGEAYMRSGWASRLVYDLLRRYTLVLVGYSADDPPMRYMLEATEDGRLNFPDLKPAYALVGDQNDNSGALREAWRGKGLQPLIYPAPQHDHSALYRSLHVWAELARDPLGWSETELARIAASNFTESSADDRRKFSFLINEISSAAVAARSAPDPAWIEALQTDAESPDDWTYFVWFRDRLRSAAAARYAAAIGDAAKQRIARAVDVVLRSRSEVLPEPYQRFWALFVQANLRPAPGRYAGRRSSAPVTANCIQDLVATLEPRLRVQKRFSLSQSVEPDAEPKDIRDFAHFRFQAADHDWSRPLERWPQDSRAEERLILALDRALSEACEIGSDAGLVKFDGNITSSDLALVHAPEEGDGLVEPGHRHGSNWRLNAPDSHNDRFAPIIRLMTGVWRRLSHHDPRAAARIAGHGSQRDEIIFKRLGAWAATVSPVGPTAVIEQYLSTTSRARYWASDHTAELVRFYCRRWNDLSARTRARIERAILAGPPAEVIRVFAHGRRRYARSLYAVRELARIRTAGGRLSRAAADRLAALYAEFPELPREMPILAHLYNPSWSGSGYSADIRALDEIADDKLLESAELFEINDRIEQADLWSAFVQNEPARAFAALVDAQNKGEFPSLRWLPLLNLYAYHDRDQGPSNLPEIVDVLAALAKATTDDLIPLAEPLSQIVKIHAAATVSPLFPEVLALWEQLLPATAAIDGEAERASPLSDTVISHPLATLAGALMTMQSNVEREAGGGFASQFATKFQTLIKLPARAGVIARGALMQELPFLHWLAPVWVEEYLLPGLLEETDEALDLMSVVAHSVAPQYPPLFNRLKGAIFRALEHERIGDTVREQLSGALVGAAFAVIEGRDGFALTNVECRRTLTRMPNSVLSRLAWELTHLLEDKPNPATRADHWSDAVEPFLTDYWPNDVSARTTEVSEHLVRLPALAGDAFERAVDVVLGLVRPIVRHELRYSLGLDDEWGLIHRFPGAMLRLITGIVDRAAQPPSDVSAVIQALLEAKPSIAADPAFWRLRLMQRPN